ncbi:MAG: tetratricopeptide repeat protein [Myxococcota bacterium]
MRHTRSVRALVVATLLCGVLGAGCSERSADAPADASADATADASGSPGGSAADLLARASRLVADGDAARALWLLEDAAERFPDDEALALVLAETALRLNDPARADRAASRVADDSPRAAEALLLRARAVLALGDLDAALERFRQAEQRDPRSTALRGPRIGALLAQGRLAEAAEAVAEATRQARGDDELALARSFELALHQYRAAHAGSALRRALRDDDALAADAARAELAAAVDASGRLARSAHRDADAWRVFVGGLVATGRADEALREVEARLRDDPDWLPLHALRVAALLARNDVDAAEQALRQAMTRDPSPAAALALARFQARPPPDAERRDAALATLDAALEEAPDDPLLLHARADLLLDREEPARAARAVDAFEAVRPDDPAGELLRARLLLLRGDPAAAADALRALAPRLDTAATQYWLARALEDGGDAAGAQRRYALSAQRAPSEPGAYAAIARLARRRGAWREAAAAGRQLALHAPGWIDGWETWVDALLQQGRAAAALDVARRARQVLPDAAGPLLLEARALRAAGRADEALAGVRQAQERFGDDPAIVSEWMLTLAALGRADEALARPARDDDPAALHHARAVVLFAAGRFDEGSRAVDAALAADADPGPLRTRCRFAASTGRRDAARRDCGRYLEVRPGDADVQFALGVALDASGDAAGAALAYERAAALDPSAAAPRNNLSHLRFAAGDLDGALEAAQQAYALAPDDPQVLDTLGELYLARGLAGRAVALLERAHALAPGDAAIEARLADARSRL